MNHSREVKGFGKIEKGPVARGTAGVDTIWHTLGSLSITEATASQ